MSTVWVRTSLNVRLTEPLPWVPVQSQNIQPVVTMPLVLSVFSADLSRTSLAR